MNKIQDKVSKCQPKHDTCLVNRDSMSMSTRGTQTRLTDTERSMNKSPTQKTGCPNVNQSMLHAWLTQGHNASEPSLQWFSGAQTPPPQRPIIPHYRWVPFQRFTSSIARFCHHWSSETRWEGFFKRPMDFKRFPFEWCPLGFRTSPKNVWNQRSK